MHSSSGTKEIGRARRTGLRHSSPICSPTDTGMEHSVSETSIARNGQKVHGVRWGKERQPADPRTGRWRFEEELVKSRPGGGARGSPL